MPADKLLAGIERLMSPKLNEIIGELKAINTRIDSTNERIDSTNERIDSLRNETKADIVRLEDRIDSLKSKMDTKIRHKFFSGN